MNSFLADLGYRNLQLEEQEARHSAARIPADESNLEWQRTPQAPCGPRDDRHGSSSGLGLSPTHSYPTNFAPTIPDEKPRNSELLPQRLYSNEPQVDHSRLRRTRFVTWGPSDTSAAVRTATEPINRVANSNDDRQHVQFLLAAVRQSLQVDRASNTNSQYNPSSSDHTNPAIHGSTAPIAADMWQNPYLVQNLSTSGSLDVAASFTSPPPRRHAPPLPTAHVDFHEMGPQSSQDRNSTMQSAHYQGTHHHLTSYESEMTCPPRAQIARVDYSYREPPASNPTPHRKADSCDECGTHEIPSSIHAGTANGPVQSHNSTHHAPPRRMRATERALLEATAGFGGSLADVLRAPPPPRMAPVHPASTPSREQGRSTSNDGNDFETNRNNHGGEADTPHVARDDVAAAASAPFDGLSLAEALGPSRPRRNAPIYAPPDESASHQRHHPGHSSSSSGRSGHYHSTGDDGFGGMSLGEVLGRPLAPPSSLQTDAYESSSSDGPARRGALTAARDPQQWRQQRPRDVAHSSNARSNATNLARRDDGHIQDERRGSGRGNQQMSRPLRRGRPNGSGGGGGGVGEASNYLADEEMTYERLLALDEPLARQRMQRVNPRTIETRIRSAMQAVRYFPKSKSTAPRSDNPGSSSSSSGGNNSNGKNGSSSGDCSNGDSSSSSSSSGTATTAAASSSEGVEDLCEDESNVEPCVICLEPFRSGERLVKIRNCRCTRHVLYHEPCLKQWLKADASCPLCRTRAFDDEDGGAGDL